MVGPSDHVSLLGRCHNTRHRSRHHVHVKPPIAAACRNVYLVAVEREDQRSQLETFAVTFHQVVVVLLGGKVYAKSLNRELRARVCYGDSTGLFLIHNEASARRRSLCAGQSVIDRSGTMIERWSAWPSKNGWKF